MNIVFSENHDINEYIVRNHFLSPVLHSPPHAQPLYPSRPLRPPPTPFRHIISWENGS